MAMLNYQMVFEIYNYDCGKKSQKKVRVSRNDRFYISWGMSYFGIVYNK